MQSSGIEVLQCFFVSICIVVQESYVVVADAERSVIPEFLKMLYLII